MQDFLIPKESDDDWLAAKVYALEAAIENLKIKVEILNRRMRKGAADDKETS